MSIVQEGLAICFGNSCYMILIFNNTLDLNGELVSVKSRKDLMVLQTALTVSEFETLRKINLKKDMQCYEITDDYTANINLNIEKCEPLVCDIAIYFIIDEQGKLLIGETSSINISPLIKYCMIAMALQKVIAFYSKKGQNND